MDGEGGVVTHYTATASYTGSTSSKYATGYTITANYTGELAKTDCSVVTYTAVFGSVEAEPAAASEAPTEAPEETTDPEAPAAIPINWSELKTPLIIGGVVLVLVFGGAFAINKTRRR